MQSLILSGAFDEFGYNKNTIMLNLENLYNYAELVKDLDETLVMKPEIAVYKEYSNQELMKHEFELYGFYLKNHPVTKYKREGLCRLDDVKAYFDKHITVIGLIENIKEIKTKNNKMMAFILISDEYSKLSVVVFPTTYENFNTQKIGDIIKVSGKIERRMNNFQMIANQIEILK